MKCRRLSPSFGATRSLSHSQSETLRLSSAWSVQSFTIARFALPMAVATRGPEMISGRRPGPGLAWPPALPDVTRQGAASRIQVAKLRLDLPQWAASGLNLSVVPVPRSRSWCRRPEPNSEVQSESALAAVLAVCQCARATVTARWPSNAAASLRDECCAAFHRDRHSVASRPIMIMPVITMTHCRLTVTPRAAATAGRPVATAARWPGGLQLWQELAYSRCTKNSLGLHNSRPA